MTTIQQNRKHEKTIGLCFILATLSYALGNSFIATAFVDPYNKTQLILGITLELVNSLCVFIIGLFTFKRLQTVSHFVLKGYRTARWLEAFILGVAAISAMLTTWFNTNMLQTFREISFAIAMIILGVYSVYFCYFLLKNNLIPRWLTMIGIVGYACLIVYCILLLLTKSASMILFAPGALFEIIFPIYLIAKGFRE